MRSSVVLFKRGSEYVAQVRGRFGGGFSGVCCGSEPSQAAARAVGWMQDYAVSNKEGGDLVAPAEVTALVPEHLRSVAAEEGVPHR